MMPVAEVLVINCGGTEVKLRGGVLVPVGSEQEQKLKTSFSFTATQKKGVQSPVEFENTKKEKVREELEIAVGSEGSYEQVGQEGTWEITFEEEAEFK